MVLQVYKISRICSIENIAQKISNHGTIRRRRGINMRLFLLIIAIIWPNLLSARTETLERFQNRDVLIVVPDAARAPDLLVSMHGLGGNINFQRGYFRVNELADSENLVIAIPKSQGPGWDFGINQARDKNFITALMASLKQRFGTNRTFLVGHSNGGLFAQNFACSTEGIIDGFASLAGATTFRAQRCANPVPALIENGSADRIIPFRAATRGCSIWASVNGCQSDCVNDQVATEGGDIKSASQCLAPTALMTIQGAGHLTPIPRGAVRDIVAFLKGAGA